MKVNDSRSRRPAAMPRWTSGRLPGSRQWLVAAASTPFHEARRSSERDSNPAESLREPVGVRMRLRIATWNPARPLNSRRRRRIAAWMHSVAADVWVLTETHDLVSPGETYSSVSSSGADRPCDPGERWVTIWSRYPAEPIRTIDAVRTVAARLARTTARR